MNVCNKCSAPLDLEQQLAQANGERACNECWCPDCNHDYSTHNGGECSTCPECLSAKVDAAKDAEPPDPMDYEDQPVFQQEYGRSDARTSVYH